MNTSFLVGSTYFFSCYSDFKSKDIDKVELLDVAAFPYRRQYFAPGRCLFRIARQNTVEDYIKWELKIGRGMALGKFLIPEFCEAIGFTINDLPKLQPLVDALDERHLYEKIIFDSYITNQAFVLTNDQRDAAYQNYKASRNI